MKLSAMMTAGDVTSCVYFGAISAGLVLQMLLDCESGMCSAMSVECDSGW